MRGRLRSCLLQIIFLANHFDQGVLFHQFNVDSNYLRNDFCRPSDCVRHQVDQRVLFHQLHLWLLLIFYCYLMYKRGSISKRFSILKGVICLSINLGCQFVIQDVHNIVIRLSCFRRLLWFCWTSFLLQTVELVVIYFKRPKISFQYLLLRRYRKIFFFEVYTFPISNIWTKCWNMFFRYLIFEQNIGMYSYII